MELIKEQQEYARTTGLSEALETLLPALETFLAFAEPEQTARQREIWSAQLYESLPQVGCGAEGVLQELRDIVIPNGLHCGAPGFSGWVATSPTTIPAVTHLASALVGSPCLGIQAFNFLENLGMSWLKSLLGLPESFQGLFTSGGSVANLLGLGAARQHAFEREGIDPAREGVAALPKPRIYASEETHHIIYRAAAVFGLGREAVVMLPANEHMQIDIACLQERVLRDREEGCTPVAVMANAGTTSTGAVDPLAELGAFCHEQNIWLHVDGAYGLLGVLDPSVKHLFGDLALADSLVVDPHKWMATSMGSGAIIVRDKELLERAFMLLPAVYIEGSQPVQHEDGPLTSQFDGFGYPFHELGFEHTLPSRGVEVWALLKEIGVEGIRARVCRHNEYARNLAASIQDSPNLELAAPVMLSTCCYRYIPASLQAVDETTRSADLNRLNQQLLTRVRARGRSMPSATFVRGNFVLRSCFINPRTTYEDILTLRDEIELCGAEVSAALGF